MQINIPQAEQQRLAQHAAEAGYSDVQLFVTEHVLALAKQPAAADLPPLSPAELEASLATIDKSMAEFAAGEGLTIDEARQRTLQSFERYHR